MELKLFGWSKIMVEKPTTDPQPKGEKLLPYCFNCIGEVDVKDGDCTDCRRPVTYMTKEWIHYYIQRYCHGE